VVEQFIANRVLGRLGFGYIEFAINLHKQILFNKIIMIYYFDRIKVEFII